MEYTITVVSLDHFMDMTAYAKLCGIDSRAIQRRIREKQVVYAVVDGLKLIDTIASPPLNKLPNGFKPQTRLNTNGVTLSDLVRISKLAADKRITTSRFYKAILLGKLKAVFIAEQFFVSKSDPAFGEVLRSE